MALIEICSAVATVCPLRASTDSGYGPHCGWPSSLTLRVGSPNTVPCWGPPLAATTTTRGTVMSSKINNHEILPMKSIINPEAIAGAVRDLGSGRICAIPSDLARALGLAPCQITSIPARRYGRYVDVLDCLEHRASVRTINRPRRTPETTSETTRQ